MGVYPISNDPCIQRESRRVIKLGMEKAAELGLNYVTIHLESQYDMSGDKRYQLFKEAVLEYLNCAEACGVVVTIENVKGLIDETRLVKEMDGPYLRMTLDVDHAYLPMQSTMYRRIDEYIELEAEIIGNVHAHDHDGIRDHLPIGKGVMDF